MKDIFNDKGFTIIEGHFSDTLLSIFEGVLVHLYRMQAAKIGISGSLNQILERMEVNDKEALYQVQKFLPSSQTLKGMIGSLSGFLGMDATNLIDGPGLFINRPHTDRLLYKWHSEEHYYPKRRNFINAWWPLFGDKTKENGTMSFKVGSHKKHYPFSEYQEGPNHFIQYEIPENFVKEFDTYYCEVKRGDLVIFHSNLVHRSNPNTTDKYSFAGVARIWNPKDDLTLSGNLAATPYGGDMGRAGLVVEP